MKRLCLRALLAIVAMSGHAAFAAETGVAGASASAPSMGEHGMVLFGGREGLYASHMPMYHRPHDVQVVFRLRLENAALDRRMRDELARHPQLWTIVPERFEIDRLASGAADPVRHLQVDIVRGHFERGGKTVESDVDVAVERVLIHRRLDPAQSKSARMTYTVIDAGPKAKEHFLVKTIEGRPDFDHIVPFACKGGGTAPATIEVRRADRIDAGSAYVALREQATRSGVQLRRAIYFESGDLQ